MVIYIGKLRLELENHGKNIGKPWENHRKLHIRYPLVNADINKLERSTMLFDGELTKFVWPLSMAH